MPPLMPETKDKDNGSYISCVEKTVLRVHVSEFHRIILGGRENVESS
jgi:hypothetical protein